MIISNMGADKVSMFAVLWHLKTKPWKQEADFILNTGKLFCDIDYFTICLKSEAIENYKDNKSIRSNRVYSYDAREEGVIFMQFQNICAISEMAVSCPFYLYSLYDHEEWPKTETVADNFNTGEWKQHLKTIGYQNTFLASRGTSSIKYTGGYHRIDSILRIK